MNNVFHLRYWWTASNNDFIIFQKRCQEDLTSCQCSHNERVKSMSQELVARDLKLQTLEDMCEKLREDVKRRDADIER